MRGYGKSDPLQAPTSRRAELYALLKHLQIEAAYLVGCSLGVTAVLDLTLEHPQMTRGLVMVNGVPSGFEMQGPPPANVTAMIEAMQKRDLPRISELQLRLWIDGPFRQPNEVDPVVRQRAAQMNQAPVRHFTAVVADMPPADPLTPPAIERLQDVHVPTLVIAGALDDPQIQRAADTLATGIKGARKVVIPGAAHIPSMEKPAEFNRILLDFLAGIER
jgi:pimeloyl-ACP methyl ester carboxylesterase